MVKSGKKWKKWKKWNSKMKMKLVKCKRHNLKNQYQTSPWALWLSKVDPNMLHHLLLRWSYSNIMFLEQKLQTLFRHLKNLKLVKSLTTSLNQCNILKFFKHLSFQNLRKFRSNSKRSKIRSESTWKESTYSWPNMMSSQTNLTK